MRVSIRTGLLLLGCLAATTPQSAPAADAVDAAYALRISGQSEQARQQLQALTAEQPQQAKGWYELARTQFYLLEFEEAQQSIDKALALEPDNAGFHYLAGTVAAYRAVLAAKKAAAGDEVGRATQRWLNELQQTVKLAPQHYRACIELANAYRQTPVAWGGDAAQAERITVRLETDSPVDGATARTLALGDKPEDVVVLWRRIVEGHAEQAAAHAGLALALLRTGQFDQAADEIDRARQLDGQRSRLYLDLAREVGKRGDYARATTAVEKFLHTEPVPAAAMRAFATFFLAAIEKRQHRDDQAEALMQQARDLDAHVWTTLVPPPEILFEKP